MIAGLRGPLRDAIVIQAVSAQTPGRAFGFHRAMDTVGAVAGQLLGVHWTTVYRLRARFLRDPVVSALAPSPLGRRNDSRRLAGDVETVITEVVRVVLLPKHES